MALLCASGVSASAQKIIAASSGAKLIIAENKQSTVQAQIINLPSHSDCTTIIAMATSCSGRWVATCTSDKHLVVWECEGWRVQGEREVPKRVTVVQFTEDEQYIITADKTGEVVRYSVLTLSDKGEELLGHLSMLLDMIITSGDSHVITCDRDEKIRVSRYPNCYNIESYCLGHTEFVSCLCMCTKWPHLLFSASGDGTVRGWDWVRGEQLSSYHCSGESGAAVTNIICCSLLDPPLLVATIEQSQNLLVFSLASSGTLSLLTEPLSLAACPWSCVFDWLGQLWVCVPTEQNPVQCWKYQNGKFHKHSSPISEVLDKWEYFKDCSDEQNWSPLRKHTYDNISSYLERKQRRIQERKGRGTQDLSDERAGEKEVVVVVDEVLETAAEASGKRMRLEM